MANFLSSLSGIGTAIGGIQSILGLFGADDAQKRAEQAAQQAILDFKTSANTAYNDTASAGTGNLYALSGRLSNLLQRQGGSVGQALANAGVYNSSAAAGAIANQGAANAGALATATTNLGTELDQMKAQTGEEAARMQLGLNQNNLNYARELYGNSVNGVSSFLSNIGQTANQIAGGRSPNAAGPGNSPLTIPRYGIGGLGGTPPFNPNMGGLLPN